MDSGHSIFPRQDWEAIRQIYKIYLPMIQERPIDPYFYDWKLKIKTTPNIPDKLIGGCLRLPMGLLFAIKHWFYLNYLPKEFEHFIPAVLREHNLVDIIPAIL